LLYAVSGVCGTQMRLINTTQSLRQVKLSLIGYCLTGQAPVVVPNHDCEGEISGSELKG